MFLGLIFDQKLSFLPHLRYLKNKCTKALNMLCVVAHLMGCRSFAYYCVKRTVYLVDFCTVVLSIFHNLCYILLSVCFVLFSLQEKNLACPISHSLPLALTFTLGFRYAVNMMSIH